MLTPFNSDGNDTLIGSGTSDTLISGTGLDMLIGGMGNETFVVNDAGDVVIVDANAANDARFEIRRMA